MARIEDGCEADTGLERSHPVHVGQQQIRVVIQPDMYSHDLVHLIVNNVPSLPKVHRVDNFIVSVFFVTI